jgi:hypothetical protein
MNADQNKNVLTAKDAEGAKDRDIGKSGHRDIGKAERQKLTAEARRGIGTLDIGKTGKRDLPLINTDGTDKAAQNKTACLWQAAECWTLCSFCFSDGEKL